MNILFDNWWQRALMKPLKWGLLNNCSNETNFVCPMMKILKILKYILYNKGFEEESPFIKSFILEKQ